MAEPFTIEHFEAWAAKLTLDNGKKWHLEPFQRSFLEDVFKGFRECWLVVPEGNGKTTLVAGLALYKLLHKNEPFIPIAASSKEQAKIMYRQARGFVKRGGAWGLRAYDGYKAVDCSTTDGRLEVFSSDDRTGDGIIPTDTFLDELHRHKDLTLYETWRGKLDKRDAQQIIISTAGEPGSEFEEIRERIRQEGERKVDGSFTRVEHPELILHEWAVPEGSSVDDMAVVKAANPFSGITEATLARKFSSPTMSLGHWRRFVCNLPTRSDMAAIQEKEWFDAQTDEEIPAGQPVDVGLDVGWKWDTTAAVPLWVRDAHHRLLGPARVLVPPRDGTSLDPNLVEHALVDLHQRNPIQTLVMDMSRAETIATWAEAEFGCRVIDRSQSNKFAAEDYEKFMEALRSGWLRHSGDRDLTRHALNAVARILPYGDARFERPAQTRNTSMQDLRVIDALTAAAMVHSFSSTKRKGGFIMDMSELLGAA
jgi:hypothetical protein